MKRLARIFAVVLLSVASPAILAVDKPYPAVERAKADL